MISCDELLRLEDAIPRMLDVSGRPIAEGRADPDVKALVPMEYRTCPYPGSRHEHKNPMNLSALGAVMQTWDEVLALVAETRRRYVEAVGQEALTVRDLLRVVEIASALPIYLHAKGSPRGSVRIPDAVASVYKVLLGPKDVLNSFVFNSGHRRTAILETTLDAEAFFEHVERSGFLIGGWEVCAGPTRAIKDLLRVICEGSPRPRRAASFYRAERVDFAELAETAARSYDLKVTLFVLGLRALALLSNLAAWATRDRVRKGRALAQLLSAEIDAVLRRRRLSLRPDELAGQNRDNRFILSRRDIIWAERRVKRVIERRLVESARQSLAVASARAFRARWQRLDEQYRELVHALDGGGRSALPPTPRLATHLGLDLGRIEAVLEQADR